MKNSPTHNHLPSGLQHELLGFLFITKNLQFVLGIPLLNHRLIESSGLGSQLSVGSGSGRSGSFKILFESISQSPNSLQVSGQSRVGFLGSLKCLIGNLPRSFLLNKCLIGCLQLGSQG
jgi:hypothetical protein